MVYFIGGLELKMNSRLTPKKRIVGLFMGWASSPVFSGALSIALGSSVGKLIGIISTPLLTRLYSPEDFGLLSVFTSLVAILTPLVTLRYVVAIPLPRTDGVALNLMVLATTLMLLLTTVIGLALWQWGERILGIVSIQVLAPWWWLIMLGVLGTATYELLTMWATRKGAYKLMAQTQATQSLAGAAVKVVMGLAAFQPFGLLAGQVVGQVGGSLRILREFRSDFLAGRKNVSLARLHKVARKHRGFPIWRVPSQFLLILSTHAPILFMAAMYNPSTTGHFGLAVMALTIPVTVLGQSAGSSLYGEAAKLIKADRKKALAIAIMTQKRLFVMALPLAAMILFFSESFFQLVFGSTWAEAGSFASLLSIASIFQLTSAPLVQVINLLRSQISFLVINVIRLSGLIIVFQAADRLSFEPRQTVLLYSAYSTIFYFSYSAFIFRILHYEALIHDTKNS